MSKRKIVKSQLVRQIVSYKTVADELSKELEHLQDNGCIIMSVIETNANPFSNRFDQGFIILYETEIENGTYE